jgi:thioredoxin 1
MAIVNLTQQNFGDFITNNEFVVIDFWAEWCEPCHAFSKILEEVAAQNPTIAFGKIDAATELELSAEFNVRSIPTLLIMRRKIVLLSESGLLPQTAVQDLLDQASKLDMDEVCGKLQSDKS